MRIPENNFKVAVIWILFTVMGCCLYGETFTISADEFKKHDVDLKRLDPINLGADGSYYAAVEGVQDVKKRAAGFTRALRIFRFKNKKLAKVDTLLLPITSWVNAVVNDTKDEILVLGNNGTKILRANLETLEVQTLWEHKKGKAGFKVGPSLLCDRGEYYATGWFYDEQQFWKGDYFAKIEIKDEENTKAKSKSKSGPEVKFIKRINLDTIFNRSEDEFNKAHYYTSGSQLLFNIVKVKERKTYLMHYKNQQITALDKGHILAVFISGESKAFYSVTYNEKPAVIQNFVMDLKTKKKWQIGKDNDFFIYPFMNKKGDRLIVCLMNEKYKVFSAYVGEEKNNYRLNKIFHNLPLGPMHLSPNGNVYSLMTAEGLRIGNF